MLYEDLQLLYFPIFLLPDGTAPLQGLQTFPSPAQLSKGQFIHILTYLHACLHRCDIFDMLMFISFGGKSIFYADWDLGSENMTVGLRLGQTLLMTMWWAGASEVQKQPAVKSWHPATGQHGPLGDQCVWRTLGSKCFGAGEQKSRPWAGPVLSGNLPIISRLQHSIEQRESAMGLDWRR